MVKRSVDIVGAGFALIALAPVAALVALTVLMGLGRPVLFRQARPGRHGHIFELVKFRSMRTARPGLTALQARATDADRLTRLGRRLRAWSLDEIPTLYNVLRGDMSLVGPRPLLVEYLDRYTPEQARRHEVRPGITGLAQVRGRNALTWEEKFACDLWYVEHRGLGLDLRILLATAWTVLRRRGVHSPGTVTAPEFIRRLPEPVVSEVGS